MIGFKAGKFCKNGINMHQVLRGERERIVAVFIGGAGYVALDAVLAKIIVHFARGSSGAQCGA